MTHELFREDAYLRECAAVITAVDERGIRLDRTVFYPEGGGQPGDTGVLLLEDGSAIVIADTRKGEQPGEILHVPAVPPPPLRPGMRVVARLDWARRYRLMRMHTCLHVLSAVIVAPVTGGQVGDGYGRLDFDLPEPPVREAVEEHLNRLIAEDHAVGYRWITDAELAARPELVKTMAVKPPAGLGRVRLVEIAGVDLQPCGGTHVARTAEIGRVAVTKIDKKGQHNRRVRLELAVP
ncbi:MAG TPA: alanyl-tRNA editing protein [Gammaproteobacteria bacterium]|nr:alanyl-tRNA editing protein [Gammaproteobacteria bacterium]